MAITVTEKFGSRETNEGESPSIDLLFLIEGTDDDILAKENMIAAAPIIYDGLIRQTAHIDQIGPLLWDGSIRYGPRKRPDTGESSFSVRHGRRDTTRHPEPGNPRRLCPAGHDRPRLPGRNRRHR